MPMRPETSAERVQARNRQIQDPPRRDVRRLGIHHLPDMTNLEVYPARSGLGFHPLQIGSFIDTDLSGYDSSQTFTNPC